MAIKKMTAGAIKARPSRRNRAKIEATTEDDIRRQMIEDGENPDEEVSESDIISPCYRMRGRVREGAFQSHSVCPDGTRDVFERLLAHVLKGKVEAPRGILLNAGRNADAAGFGQAFEPRGDIDAVTKDVAVLDENVANIDADAELDAMLRRQRRVAFGQSRLHFRRASEGVDDAGEFDQQPVAGGLDDAAAMLGDLRIDYLGAERPQPAERPFLVGPDQSGITGNIGREDRCEPAFDAS